MNKQTTLDSLNSNDNLYIIIMNYDSGATFCNKKCMGFISSNLSTYIEVN